MKTKLKKFFRWILNECKDIKTVVLFVIVVIFMYSPVWGGYTLYAIFRWKWCLVAASGYLALWAGPFTPFFPLCLIITLGIKRIIKRILKRKNDEDN